MTTKQRASCQKICEHYGIERQRRQLIEECAELIQATSKVERPERFTTLGETFKNLTSEIADVEIMLEQIKGFYLLQELVKKEIDYKLNRQLDRIAKERGAQ